MKNRISIDLDSDVHNSLIRLASNTPERYVKRYVETLIATHVELAQRGLEPNLATSPVPQHVDAQVDQRTSKIPTSDFGSY